MLRKIFFILFFCVISSQAYSQYYPEVWDSTIVYENEYYKIEVPKKWRYLEQVTNEKTPHHFEGSGIGFPVYVNDNVFIVNVTVFYVGKVDTQDSLVNMLLADVLKGKDTDKIFPEGFEPLIDTLTIKSGEVQKIIKHRYFRKSKDLNQTRYTMAVLNPKTKNAFLYAISLQYLGDYDSFEQYLKLDEFSINVYKRFELK